VISVPIYNLYKKPLSVSKTRGQLAREQQNAIDGWQRRHGRTCILLCHLPATMVQLLQIDHEVTATTKSSVSRKASYYPTPVNYSRRDEIIHLSLCHVTFNIYCGCVSFGNWQFYDFVLFCNKYFICLRAKCRN
jgi:hypothetical protein